MYVNPNYSFTAQREKCGYDVNFEQNILDYTYSICRVCIKMFREIWNKVSFLAWKRNFIQAYCAVLRQNMYKYFYHFKTVWNSSSCQQNYWMSIFISETEISLTAPNCFFFNRQSFFLKPSLNSPIFKLKPRRLWWIKWPEY